MRKSALFVLAFAAVFFLGASNLAAVAVECYDNNDCDDGLDCTIDSCVLDNGEITVLNGIGYCVYEYEPEGTFCDDVPDTYECANPGCDGSGTCVPTLLWEPDGTPCTDTGIDCLIAACLHGVCDQEQIPEQLNTPCNDVADTEECADPGCDGLGNCIPIQIDEPAGTACGDPADTECDNPDTPDQSEL